MHIIIDITHLSAYIIFGVGGVSFLKSINNYVGMTIVVPHLAAPLVFVWHSGGGSYFPCSKA